MSRLQEGEINSQLKNGVRYYRACVGKKMEADGELGTKTHSLGPDYGAAMIKLRRRSRKRVPMRSNRLERVMKLS